MALVPPVLRALGPKPRPAGPDDGWMPALPLSPSSTSPHHPSGLGAPPPSWAASQPSRVTGRVPRTG
jgi:hypothetical protein